MTDSPIVGFRYWYVWHTGLLYSISGYRDPWPTEEPLTASCEVGPAPAWGCDCGIHAYYSLGKVPQPFYGLRGAVACGGAVIEHEHGFRAQCAKIVALEDLPYSQRDVAERYDVPLLPATELVQYAEWWGEVKHPVPH